MHPALTGVVLEMLTECVMILGSRLRSSLAQKRQASVGSLEVMDVPNGFHVGRPAGESRRVTDVGISFARQPLLCEQLVRVQLLKHALIGLSGCFRVKECEVLRRAVNLFATSCV